MKLTEAIEFTTQVRRAWKPTAKGYKTAMINSKHCVEVLGDVDVDKIDAMSFINIQECLTAEGKTPGTVNRITSALSTVLTVMKQFNHITHKPGFSNLKEPRGKDVFYTDEEVEQMLLASDVVGGEIKDIILFASKTGARRGEIEDLQWSDVNLSKGDLTFIDTKTGEDRILPLVGSLRDLVERLHSERTGESVFDYNGAKILYELRKVQRIARVSEEKCFHTLRHTATSNLWKKGANLVQIMDTLGHRQSATTLRYSHAGLEGKAEALALL